MIDLLNPLMSWWRNALRWTRRCGSGRATAASGARVGDVSGSGDTSGRPTSSPATRSRDRGRSA